MRLPFFYGWIIVAVAFVSTGIGVNARTAFSLLLPPILGEFGWGRGVIAGAFSFGFIVSALLSPTLGWLMDRHGPRAVMGLGVAMMASGLMLASQIVGQGLLVYSLKHFSPLVVGMALLTQPAIAA